MAKRIILFRFHKDFDIARERVKILKHFNPNVPIHVLFGGLISEAEEAGAAVLDIVDSFWVYHQERNKTWKWLHTDIMTKEWFRDVGQSIDFDYMYSYEYDLLTLAPLDQIYPPVENDAIALAAAEPFTKKIEGKWYWTSKEPDRSRYVKFCEYMKRSYDLGRQKMVCLGPGPLLSRKFMEMFADTEDVDYVHEEITFPAYAEVFNIPIVNNGLHPGFFKHSDEDKYFNCNKNKVVKWEEIIKLIKSDHKRRAFHPVKEMVTLDQVNEIIKYTKSLYKNKVVYADFDSNDIENFAEEFGYKYIRSEIIGPDESGYLMGPTHYNEKLDIVRWEEGDIEFEFYSRVFSSLENEKAYDQINWKRRPRMFLGLTFSIKLPYKLPSVIVQSLVTRTFWNIVGINALFVGKRARLEGDFNRYFRVYTPDGEISNAFYAFAPNTMYRILNSGSDIDFQFAGNRIYFNYDQRMKPASIFKHLGLKADIFSLKKDKVTKLKQVNQEEWLKVLELSNNFANSMIRASRASRNLEKTGGLSAFPLTATRLNLFLLIVILIVCGIIAVAIWIPYALLLLIVLIGLRSLYRFFTWERKKKLLINNWGDKDGVETQSIIFLRGPSGAGKSTVAKRILRETKRNVIVIEQDMYRQRMSSNLNSFKLRQEMILNDCIAALENGYDVILDGIFNFKRHDVLFDQIINVHPKDNYFFYFDVPFDETVRRHATREKSKEFDAETMRNRYAVAKPTGYKNEFIISDKMDEDKIVRIIDDKTGILG